MTKRDAWIELMASAHQCSDPWMVVELVNKFFNSIDYVSDLHQYGVEDKWATPDEFLEREAGDCEDFAIAKFFTFKKLYNSEADISLMFCKKIDGGQNHMVLVHTFLGNRCILDNETGYIKTIYERPDILGIFSFNSTQVFLEKNNLPVPLKQGINKVKKWQTILQKTKLL